MPSPTVPTAWRWPSTTGTRSPTRAAAARDAGRAAGIEATVDRLADLGDRPGAHRPGRKVRTLVHALVAGGEGIDDAAVLRTGSTAAVLGRLLTCQAG
jgi:hypothetical protein